MPRLLQIQLKKHQEMVQKSWDAQRLEREAERERQREEDARVERVETAAAAEREREIAEVEEKKRYIILLGIGRIPKRFTEKCDFSGGKSWSGRRLCSSRSRP